MAALTLICRLADGLPLVQSTDAALLSAAAQQADTFTRQARAIVATLAGQRQGEARATVEAGGHSFCYYVSADDNLVLLAGVADKSYPKQLVFGYLAELRAAFVDELRAGDAAAPAASEAAPKKSKSKLSPEARARARGGLARMVERWPWWIFPLLRLLEWGGIALFVLQIPVTYALVRLDYELRWYLVTDRSLRIRTGLTTVQEATMSFANLQQVVVTQGPLQRLLGLADVRVQSAGGGGDSHEQKGGDSLHTGVFHGVDNASEVRDLILERLRVFRETGLGDPDEPAAAPPPLAPAAADSAAPASASAATLAAARELLAEARALRAAVS